MAFSTVKTHTIQHQQQQPQLPTQRKGPPSATHAIDTLSRGGRPPSPSALPPILGTTASQLGRKTSDQGKRNLQMHEQLKNHETLHVQLNRPPIKPQKSYALSGDRRTSISGYPQGDIREDGSVRLSATKRSSPDRAPGCELRSKPQIIAPHGKEAALIPQDRSICLDQSSDGSYIDSFIDQGKSSVRPTASQAANSTA